jgi:serine/threonine-protein kinase RsbW
MPSMRFTTDPSCPAKCRHFVRSVLGSCPESVVATAELVTSELVTNAIVHGLSGGELELRMLGDHLRIEVSDSSPVPPVPRQASPYATNGRGLEVVEALSREWGVEHRSSGKSVWAAVGTASVED